MPAYDGNLFQPPAPLAHVTLRAPGGTAAEAGVPMLLDTGADVTLIPRDVVNRLGVAVASDQQYELLGFDGTPSLLPVARLELLFCHRTFRGQFLVITQSWGILGRNILNLLPLLFDGPRNTWEEYRQATS